MECLLFILVWSSSSMDQPVYQNLYTLEHNMKDLLQAEKRIVG